MLVDGERPWWTAERIGAAVVAVLILAAVAWAVFWNVTTDPTHNGGCRGPVASCVPEQPDSGNPYQP